MASKRTRKDFEADLQKKESPFVIYGTPLPPLDESARDDGSYVPIWKQEVTDDRGRKRLHGAFTGGFSAGYFNTVGSKEGWTPSTFVSSRSNRMKDGGQQTQQQPEDFMDDEDRREQEEVKVLSARQDFSGFGTTAEDAERNALTDLLRPTEDTIGIKLLNRMGWRQGQGIGPKVRRKAASDDDSGKMLLFAPDDIALPAFTRKTDTKGLGYTKQAGIVTSLNSPDATITSRSRAKSNTETKDDHRDLDFAQPQKRAAGPKRGAFGVGVLNDTGSDDEDPYSMGPKISYNRVLGGEKKVKKSKNVSSNNTNPLLKAAPVFISKKLTSMSHALRKCHDGKLPLAGFVLATELDKFSTMSLNDDKYKPPQVPDGWKPARMTSTEDSTKEGSYHSSAEIAKASSHTSTSRGSLLGESVLPGKSVFDFLTPAAREKLMNITGKTDLPPARGEFLTGTAGTGVLSSSAPDTAPIPSLNRQTALQALSRLLSGGFSPYANEPAKGVRYKAFLEYQVNSQQSTMTDDRPTPSIRQSSLPTAPGLPREEHLLELQEFARTAEVFKPVSELMASRFTTSSSSSSSTPNPSQNVNVGIISSSSSSSSNPNLADLLTKPVPIASQPTDPAEEAARIGMFGSLTRSTISFYPNRLLCKRFGVAMPTHVDESGEQNGGSSSGSDGRKGRRTAGPTAATAAAAARSYTEDSTMDGDVQMSQPLNNSYTITADQQRVNTIDPDKNEALEQEKPGMAVFRAIFGSSSDDEDEDGNGK